jgi:hypothetical protein
MLSVENILGADHDVWAVNVEEDYHEEIRNEPRQLPLSAAGAAEVVGRAS